MKFAWTAWILVWAPLYWKHYGAQNFLYFCDLGNLLITLGLWLESRLILSWQAVGLLLFQTLYTVDLLAALVLKIHLIGGTEYMFDPGHPASDPVARPVSPGRSRTVDLGSEAPRLRPHRAEVSDRDHLRRGADQLFLASRIRRELRPRNRARTAPDARMALSAGIFGDGSAGGVLADALGAVAMGKLEPLHTVMYSLVALGAGIASPFWRIPSR